MSFARFTDNEFPFDTCCAQCFGGCGRFIYMSARLCDADDYGCCSNVRSPISLGMYVLVTECGCVGPVCAECSCLDSISCMFCGEETTVFAKDKEGSSFTVEHYWDVRCYEDITEWFTMLDVFYRVLYMLGDVNHSAFFTWMKQNTDTFVPWVDMRPNEETQQLLHSFKQYVALSKSSFFLTCCLPVQQHLVCSRKNYRTQLATEFFRMCHIERFPMTFPRKEITSQCLLGFVGMIVRRMTHSDYVLKTAWNRLFAIIFYRLHKRLLKV